MFPGQWEEEGGRERESKRKGRQQRKRLNESECKTAGMCYASAPRGRNSTRNNEHWAHGVVVSHPLSMREALGSIPSVSIFRLVPILT